MRMYEDQRAARNVRTINHYGSPNLSYPNVSQVSRLKPRPHVWTHGDRFYKLAHQYYSDKRLWWLIAWYNMTPTENHVVLGQILQIPLPLEAALSVMKDRER